MSRFDGSDEDLTYGAALVEVAQRASYPTEAHRNDVVRAIQAEHGLLPPEPDPTTGEIEEEADRKLRELRAAKARRERDAEIAALEAEAAAAEAATDPAAPPAQPVV